MVNSFYYEEDPLVDRFIKNAENSSKLKKYLKLVQEYLKEMYSCNFTQFISQCIYPEYCEVTFWEDASNEDKDIHTLVDDIYYEMQSIKKRKDLLGDGNTSVYRVNTN